MYEEHTKKLRPWWGADREETGKKGYERGRRIFPIGMGGLFEF